MDVGVKLREVVAELTSVGDLVIIGLDGMPDTHRIPILDNHDGAFSPRTDGQRHHTIFLKPTLTPGAMLCTLLHESGHYRCAKAGCTCRSGTDRQATEFHADRNVVAELLGMSDIDVACNGCKGTGEFKEDCLLGMFMCRTLDRSLLAYPEYGCDANPFFERRARRDLMRDPVWEQAEKTAPKWLEHIRKCDPHRVVRLQKILCVANWDYRRASGLGPHLLDR